MSKENSTHPEDDGLQAAVQKEVRRLQKTLATLSCLKLALAEEMTDEIDCEDVAAVVCKLLAKSIKNLDTASSRSRD